MPSAMTSSTSARAAPNPQLQLGDLLLDEHRDHDVALPAEERRGDVEAKSEDEDEQATGGHSRQAEREEDAREHGRGRGAEIAGGPQQIAVDAAHDRVQGQDHERQEDMDHPGVDRQPRVEQLHRLACAARWRASPR